MTSVQTISLAVTTTNAAAELDTEVITGLASFADGRTSRYKSSTGDMPRILEGPNLSVLPKLLQE
jgi:hypothetical protein